ncbi:uncharacterized protein BT62DRAFT_1078513 [Guyanagaster necrorhizus]|uniref:F-box domain-containing protein n=1 Tax=Guyanagaster necrorhizus TaxID=856835 RepID=A0A9P8APK8_9AGAR|nr:uncharacterized protein BT62DRAFT_1078513 [Guyanagaster necrorhizus MCA 3950]KAG7443448.1 hypothetical protein BT62DRAFT_1078513 [Guyanagaster necrorhizus MCA 3950]
MGEQQYLPTEIWQEIFICCLPDLKKATHYMYYRTSDLVPPPPSTRDAPLLLLLVCRTWWYWALHTPELWARLSINVDWGISYPPLPQVHSWLMRSESVPLMFSLRQNSDWASDRILTRKFLQRLLCDIYRWQHVSLHHCHDEVLRTLAEHNNVVPQALRSVYLSYPVTPPTVMTRELTSALQHLTSAPTFSSLIVVGINIFRCLDDPYHIHWARLTELTLDDLSHVSTCLTLLALCPLLVRCTIGVRNATYTRLTSAAEQHIHPPPPPGRTIALPHLAALALMLPDVDLPMLFATPLHAPALRSLTLSLAHRLSNIAATATAWPQAAFAAWLAQTQCVLARITLCYTHMQSGAFHACLALPAFAGVHKLVVRERASFPAGWAECMSRDALAALTVRGGREGGCVLLPKLEVLVLWGQCVEAGGSTALVEMVASRCHAGGRGGGGGVARLRKFSWSRVADYDYVDFGDLCTLKALKDGGLEVHICRGGGRPSCGCFWH